MHCYSTGSLPAGLSASQIAEILLPTVFRGIELVLTPEWLRQKGDESYWLGFRTELQARGFSVRNVHLGSPFLLGPQAHSPGLGSLIPEQRQLRIDAALAAMTIAKNLHCPFLTLTTGLPERGDKDVQEKNVYASLQVLIDKRPKSVKIAIEQEPEHLIRSSKQLLNLCRTFEGEVFANFDVGHSHVLQENPAQAILELAPYLSNIHLEDIRDRVHQHLLFGAGNIDFLAIFGALRAIGYQGDLTPDLYPYCNQPEKGLTASQEFLRFHAFFQPKC